MEAAAADQSWKLVGIYDATALSGLGAAERAAQGESPPSNYVWVSAPGMRESCGVAKAPDGLGVFEAESFSSGLAPALVILLERPPDAPPLSREDVRVSLGRDEPSFRLEPALMPRTIAVSITGEGDEKRYRELVRTQLAMELCMEHKVGRAWIGGDSVGLRQAFLLDPPDTSRSESSYLGDSRDPTLSLGPPGERADRKYFGGQRDPVPALLGPPDACLSRESKLDDNTQGGTKGEGSLDLVPSDVWGSQLRRCNELETSGTAALSLPRALPLRLSELGEAPSRTPLRAWTALDVVVGPGERDEDITVRVTWGDQEILPESPLFSKPEDPGEEPGITDLLANVPYLYPTVGPASDPGRYTALIIPNWQLVEGLRRLHLGNVSTPLPIAGGGVQDGVGMVLHNPELLFVQVPEGGKKDSSDWLNLARPLTGEPMGLLAWGYTTGLLSGRKPIALAGLDTPSWKLVAEAQRAGRHGLFLGALAVLAGLVFAGFRRLSDLWTAVPEERVAYWPGRGGDAGEPVAGGPPPAAGGGGKS